MVIKLYTRCCVFYYLNMAKRNKKQPVDVANLQPDEVNALRVVVKEFMDRMQRIDSEIDTLKSDKKELVEEFSDKLDLKTLNAALRVTKIQSEVEFKDTFDIFCEVLCS